MKMLKTIREARGLTQKRCAEQLGIPLQRWMRWENRWQDGKNDPPPAMREAIADLFNVSLDQLAGRHSFDLPLAS